MVVDMVMSHEIYVMIALVIILWEIRWNISPSSARTFSHDR